MTDTVKWTELEEELLRFCSDFLYKLADFEEEEALYWVAFADSEGDHYCYDCCEEEVDKINKESVAKGEEPEAQVDGGWGGIDEDGTTFCYGCNVRLDVSYTQYAVESEVDHFLTCDLINEKELSNDQLIDLYYVFYYGSEWYFDKRYKKDILRLAGIVSTCLGINFGVVNRFELLDL
jgi:hypothetical protein